MKVAIMGAGFVGESLARSLIKAGHEVMLSSRTPEIPKMQQLVADLGPSAQAGTVEQTFAYSDVVALALGGDTVFEVASHFDDWSGKTVLDMTQCDSMELAETVGSGLVKIFNTIGAEHYQDPVFQGQAASMLYCGDNADSKTIAAQLAADIGFDPVDAGPLSMSTHLVNLAFVWINLMRQGQGRDFAFKLIRR